MSHDRLTPEAKRILQPYFAELDLDRIRVYSRIPWYVIARPAGYTNRYRIYLDRESLCGDPLELFALLSHELEHARQYQKYGKWRFRFLYLFSYLKKRLRGLTHTQAYRNIEFEVEARDTESRVIGELLARSVVLPVVFDQSGREKTYV